MTQALEFIVRHGYTMLFAFVLIEQLGLPLPAIPLLLAAGALAAAGKMNFALAAGAAIAASLIADVAWFELGRRRGGRVLSFLCRMSLEPDSCVRKTELAFSARGARTLLLAKFIPGLSTMAPPLAGIVGMPVRRFLLFDISGAVLWTGFYAGLGYIFSDQLDRVARAALQLGGYLFWLIAGLLVLYMSVKFWERQRFLRKLRIARITPEELKTKLDAGEDIAIVDLRAAIDFDTVPHLVVNAIRMSPEEIEHRHELIPRDRDVVLYCT